MNIKFKKFGLSPEDIQQIGTFYLWDLFPFLRKHDNNEKQQSF